jgi:hypothetical protein
MSDSETSNAIIFEGVSPILRVPICEHRLLRSQTRFKIDWQGPGLGSVSRGRCHIFLSEGDQGNPGSWVWIGVEDAEALFNEYRIKAAKVRHPPTNYPWLTKCRWRI